MAAPNGETEQVQQREQGSWRTSLRELSSRLGELPRRLGRLVPRIKLAWEGVTSEPAGSRAGWRVVASKEFSDNIGSLRFGILLLLLGLACVGVVVAAAGTLRDAATQATETPSPFLLLFTLSPQDLAVPVPEFVWLVSFFGPLLGIFLGFDAINQERSEGTLPRLVSQPIYRDDVVNGKFVAGLLTIGVALVTFVAVTSGLGILLMGITPSASDVARLLVYLVVTLAYIGVWLAFAVLCSVLLRRASTVLTVVVVVWLVLTLFGNWLAGAIRTALGLEYNLAQLTPAGLYDQSSTALLNPSVRTLDVLSLQPEQVDRAVPSILSLDQSILIVWPQFTALIAGCVVLFTVAYVAFLRQEIRA